MNNLKDLVPTDRDILFVCIGTDRSTGDSLGPLTGTFLEQEGYEVLGTLHDPVHAVNLKSKLELIVEKYPNHFVIAIDACLGLSFNIGEIKIEVGSLMPGKAVGKDLPPVGDVSIKGIVNVGGFQTYTVLQNTRLSVVWTMAKEIVEMCNNSIEKPSKKSFTVAI